MANVNKLSDIVADAEGGFVNHVHDKGGATNMGITIGTWRQIGYDKDGDGDIDINDIKMLDKHDFSAVLKIYWNRWQGNYINNQSVANLLVDWIYTSGNWGIKIPQRVLGIKDDGVVGPATLKALNSANQKELFDKLFEARKKFFNDIVKRDANQKAFIKGWLSRLNKFKFSE